MAPTRPRAQVRVESVAGVDAAKRVLDGEKFDVVVLAADAIDKLMHVVAGQIQPGDIVVAALTAECSDGFFADLLTTNSLIWPLCVRALVARVARETQSPHPGESTAARAIGRPRLRRARVPCARCPRRSRAR